jgi:hypothetical protein
MLWGYIVIDTNKILTIKCYLWLSYSANPCTKIVKEQICSEQTKSKTMVAKYPKKNYLNWPWENNPSHRTIQAVKDNPSQKKKKSKYFKLHWVTGPLTSLSIECLHQKMWVINKMAKLNSYRILLELLSHLGCFTSSVLKPLGLGITGQTLVTSFN